MSKMAAKLPDMAEERELAKKLLTALEGDQDVLTHLQYVPKKTFNTEYDVDKLLKAGANNFTQQTGSLNRSLASTNTSSLLQGQFLDGSNNSSAISKNSLGSGYTSFTSDGADSIPAGASKKIGTTLQLHFALQKKKREERKKVYDQEFEENRRMEKKYKNWTPEDWVKNKLKDIDENPEKPKEILEVREFLQSLLDPTMGQLGKTFPNRERAWESCFPNQYPKLSDD